MKKTIMSLVAAISIVGGSTALMASDNTSLTKATVKLIKTHHAIENQMNNLAIENSATNKMIAEQSEAIKLINGQKLEIDQDIKEVKGKIQANQTDISKIYNQMENIKKNSDITSTNSLDSRKIVTEMRTISKEFESKAEKSSETTKTLFKKINVISENFEQLKLAVMKANEKSIQNKNIIEKNNISLEKLKESSAQKDNDIKELKSSMKSLQIRFNAEIKILKAKFERARPVYVTGQEPAEIEETVTSKNDCIGGNCSEKGTDLDNTIKNYIK